MSTYDWTLVGVVLVLVYIFLKFIFVRPGWTARMAARTQMTRQNVAVRYWRIRRKLDAKTRRAREHALHH